MPLLETTRSYRQPANNVSGSSLVTSDFFADQAMLLSIAQRANSVRLWRPVLPSMLET